jgi:hypothetical protein
MDNGLADNTLFFKRFPDQSPTQNCDVFTNNGDPVVADAR